MRKRAWEGVNSYQDADDDGIEGINSPLAVSSGLSEGVVSPDSTSSACIARDHNRSIDYLIGCQRAASTKIRP